MYPQRSVMTCGLATALEPPHFNHAPVRGATPAPDLRIRGRVVSIHAPAWGATSASGNISDDFHVFQSTHPRGVRPGTAVPSARFVQGFNPRTRVGCDPEARDYLIEMQMFQSTHPRGVRQHKAALPCHRDPVSIHAPAWGATCSLQWRRWRPPPCFNPRTRVGCDSRPR